MTRIAAFYDVDETIINIKSMFSFLQFFYQSCDGQDKGRSRFESMMKSFQTMAKERSRAEVNRYYYQQFKGFNRNSFIDMTQSWFQEVHQSDNFFINETLETLRWHQAQGHLIVFVSGASHEILRPLASLLNVQHILGVQLETQDDLFTGAIIPPQTIGEGKAEAVKYFMEKHKICARESFAYGDHHTDIPMLQCVGHPHVLRGDDVLEQWASENNGSFIEVIH